MTAATEPPPRIATLDIVRGVAVMGILAMNIVGFAMPFQAYFNPTALGPISDADLSSWAVSFVLVDGKMRGLFSFLFGASMLLVIEQAEAKGEPAERIHYRRMFWLLAFGLAHLYLIWFGDILAGYALVGMLAFLFRNRPPSELLGWAVGLLVVQLLIFLTDRRRCRDAPAGGGGAGRSGGRDRGMANPRAAVRGDERRGEGEGSRHLSRRL